MAIDAAAAAAGLVGLALDGATHVSVETSLWEVETSAAFARRLAATPGADFGRGVGAALWARLFEVRASLEAEAAAVARFHVLGGGGMCLAGPAGGGAQAEPAADLAAARLHAPETAGFPGRDVAAAAAAAVAAEEAAAAFHRELSVSRRGDAPAPVAAEEAAAARLHRASSMSLRGGAAAAAGVEEAGTVARFHRELSVSRRGDAAAAAAAVVEAAAAAGVAAEAEAAEAAGFQGLLCAFVDVRAGAGSPAVGRRTGWRVGRGEAAAAAAVAALEMEAVATDAVHFQPVL